MSVFCAGCYYLAAKGGAGAPERPSGYTTVASSSAASSHLVFESQTEQIRVGPTQVLVVGSLPVANRWTGLSY